MGSGVGAIGGQVGSGVALLRATGLFSHDTSDAHTFREGRTSHELEPAGALAEAVLLTAAIDLTSRSRELRDEALGWVREHDAQGVRPFSLEWCCNALEIDDTEAVRHLLEYVLSHGLAPNSRRSHHTARRHRETIVPQRHVVRRRPPRKR